MAMFSQRKRFYQRKSFYGIVLVALLAFGFWINYEPNPIDKNSDEGQQPIVSTGEEIPLSGNEQNQGNKTFPDSSLDSPLSQGENNLEDSNIPKGPGYLIKEDGGFIKIYSIDEFGNHQLVQTTDISFSLLSEGDQELFRTGIVKKTQEELLELLQDFES